jgi:hypothetical protein
MSGAEGKDRDKSSLARATLMGGNAASFTQTRNPAGASAIFHPSAPISGQRPHAVASLEDEAELYLPLIKLFQTNRRSRDRLFPICGGEDPSWDIVLYILEQDLLRQKVSVTSACHATSVPQTTAMRKIDELVAAGLLVRTPDVADRRRVLVKTTTACRDAAHRYFETTLGQLRRLPDSLKEP